MEDDPQEAEETETEPTEPQEIMAAAPEISSTEDDPGETDEAVRKERHQGYVVTRKYDDDLLTEAAKLLAQHGFIPLAERLPLTPRTMERLQEFVDAHSGPKPRQAEDVTDAIHNIDVYLRAKGEPTIDAHQSREQLLARTMASVRSDPPLQRWHMGEPDEDGKRTAVGVPLKKRIRSKQRLALRDEYAGYLMEKFLLVQRSQPTNMTAQEVQAEVTRRFGPASPEPWTPVQPKGIAPADKLRANQEVVAGCGSCVFYTRPATDEMGLAIAAPRNTTDMVFFQFAQDLADHNRRLGNHDKALAIEKYALEIGYKVSQTFVSAIISISAEVVSRWSFVDNKTGLNKGWEFKAAKVDFITRLQDPKKGFETFKISKSQLSRFTIEVLGIRGKTPDVGDRALITGFAGHFPVSLRMRLPRVTKDNPTAQQRQDGPPSMIFRNEWGTTRVPLQDWNRVASDGTKASGLTTGEPLVRKCALGFMDNVRHDARGIGNSFAEDMGLVHEGAEGIIRDSEKVRHDMWELMRTTDPLVQVRAEYAASDHQEPPQGRKKNKALPAEVIWKVLNFSGELVESHDIHTPRNKSIEAIRDKAHTLQQFDWATDVKAFRAWLDEPQHLEIARTMVVVGKHGELENKDAPIPYVIDRRWELYGIGHFIGSPKKMFSEVTNTVTGEHMILRRMNKADAVAGSSPIIRGAQPEIDGSNIPAGACHICQRALDEHCIHQVFCDGCGMKVEGANHSHPVVPTFLVSDVPPARSDSVGRQNPARGGRANAPAVTRRFSVAPMVSTQVAQGGCKHGWFRSDDPLSPAGGPFDRTGLGWVKGISAEDNRERVAAAMARKKREMLYLLLPQLKARFTEEQKYADLLASNIIWASKRKGPEPGKKTPRLVRLEEQRKENDRLKDSFTELKQEKEEQFWMQISDQGLVSA